MAVMSAATHLLNPSSVLAGLLLAVLAGAGLWTCWRYWREAVPLRTALGLDRPTPLWLPLVALASSAHLLAFAVSWLLVSLQLTRGPSMTPTLRHHDLEVVWRSAYGLPRPFTEGYLVTRAMPARGEVVTANYRGQLGMVKRVIGIPGDTVEVARERITVNGLPLQIGPAEPPSFPAIAEDADLGLTVSTRQIPEASGQHRYTVLDQPGIARSIAPHPKAFARRDRFPCTWVAEILRCVVPPGQVFLLGDNRPVSADSRLLGTVPMEEIYGRTVLRVDWQSGGLSANRL